VIWNFLDGTAAPFRAGMRDCATVYRAKIRNHGVLT
jgi:hypothetical protein